MEMERARQSKRARQSEMEMERERARQSEMEMERESEMEMERERARQSEMERARQREMRLRARQRRIMVFGPKFLRLLCLVRKWKRTRERRNTGSGVAEGREREMRNTGSGVAEGREGEMRNTGSGVAEGREREMRLRLRATRARERRIMVFGPKSLRLLFLLRKWKRARERRNMASRATSIFIRCLRLDKAAPTSEWYKINPFQDKDKVYVELKPVTGNHPYPYQGTAGCVGTSKLYLFGGRRILPPSEDPCEDEKFTNEIHFYDTSLLADPSSPKEKKKKILFWIKHPSVMLSKRCAPFAVPLKEKIYIFGSKITGEIGCWAEVFDTMEGTLAPLSDPPEELLSNSMCITAAAVIDKASKILFVVDSVDTDPKKQFLYFYKVTKDEWKRGTKSLPPPSPLLHKSPSPSPFLRRRSPPSFFPSRILPLSRHVVMDNIFYTFVYGKVYAFDLTKKKWSKSHVKGLFLDFLNFCPPNCPIGSVHQLGPEKLYVVFSQYANTQYIYWESFRPTIKKKDGCEWFVEAQVDSRGSHVIPGITFLIDSVAL